MEEAFTFDLSHFPSSLFNDNGTLRTMAKADLANSLKLTTVSGAEPEKLKIVLDGGLLGGGGRGGGQRPVLSCFVPLQKCPVQKNA